MALPRFSAKQAGPKSSKALEKALMARRAIQQRSGQKKGYNPYRDAHGRFAPGPHKAAGTPQHAAAVVGAFTRARKLAAARAPVKAAAAPTVKAHEAARAKIEHSQRVKDPFYIKSLAEASPEKIARIAKRKGKKEGEPAKMVAAVTKARKKSDVRYQSEVEKAKPTTDRGAVKAAAAPAVKAHEVAWKKANANVVLNRAEQKARAEESVAKAKHKSPSQVARAKASAEKDAASEARIAMLKKQTEESSKVRKLVEAHEKARQVGAKRVADLEATYKMIYGKKAKSQLKKEHDERKQKARAEEKAKSDAELKRQADVEAKARADAESKAVTDKIKAEYKALETKAKKEITATAKKANLDETKANVERLTKQETEITAKMSDATKRKVDEQIANHFKGSAKETAIWNEYKQLAAQKNELNYKLYVQEGVAKLLQKREAKKAAPMIAAFHEVKRKLDLAHFYALKKIRDAANAKKWGSKA